MGKPPAMQPPARMSRWLKPLDDLSWSVDNATMKKSLLYQEKTTGSKEPYNLYSRQNTVYKASKSNQNKILLYRLVQFKHITVDCMTVFPPKNSTWKSQALHRPPPIRAVNAMTSHMPSHSGVMIRIHLWTGLVKGKAISISGAVFTRNRYSFL